MSDLLLRELTIRDFRNYEDFALRDINPLTIFVGPNAIGKTNLVEAIQLITALDTFRSAHTQELIRMGADQSTVLGRLVSDSRDLEIHLKLAPGQRNYLLNGKHKQLQDLHGLLPAVVFSPDDLMLIKGSNTLRRSTLDALACQLSKNHLIIKRDYEKLVRHKNALLKEEHVQAALLDSVDDMLVMTGAQLYRYRVHLFSRLVEKINGVYATISNGNEQLEASYIPSWESEQTKREGECSPILHIYEREEAENLMGQALVRERSQEIARGRAVIGPHADHICFFINGCNAAKFASQGQQRSIVLAWKIAEVSIIQEILGVKPLLLLDDVMSELDETRRNAMVQLLMDDIQTFITTTDTSFFNDDILGRANVIDLKELRCAR